MSVFENAIVIKNANFYNGCVLDAECRTEVCLGDDSTLLLLFWPQLVYCAKQQITVEILGANLISMHDQTLKYKMIIFITKTKYIRK